MFMIFKANHLQLTTVSGMNQTHDGKSRAVEDSIGGRSLARGFSFLITETKWKEKKKNHLCFMAETEALRVYQSQFGKFAYKQFTPWEIINHLLLNMFFERHLLNRRL